MVNDMSKNGVREPSGGPKLNHKNSLVNGSINAELKVKPQEWVKMSFHALKSCNISFRNTQRHITLIDHSPRWTHAQNRFSHGYEASQNVWHDNKCLLCCQSITMSTCRAGICYTEGHFKKWHLGQTITKKRDRHWMAATVAGNATVAVCEKACGAETKEEWRLRQGGNEWMNVCRQ